MNISSFILLVLFLFNVHSAQATWAAMDERELIDYSDLIVKATYLGKTIIRFQGMSTKKQVGVLQIEQVYKGKNLQIALLSLPLRPNNVIASTDIDYAVGQKGIWILGLDNNSEGLYLANHPQRFWHSDQLSKLLKLLSQKKP